MKNPTILFLDDDYYEMLALKERLEAQGYDVTMCSCPADAEKLLQAGTKPDLIISDLIMRTHPDQAPAEAHEVGVKFCQKVRQVFGLYCPILVLSVMTDQQVRQGVENLVDGFLLKPVAAGTLVNRVRDALKGRRSQ